MSSRGSSSLAHVAVLIFLTAFQAGSAQDPNNFVLGIYGPYSSIDMQYAAMAVAFDLDFRKNFDPDLVARLGPPIVQVPDLDPSLRFQVQLCDTASETDVGMRCAVNFFQGRQGFDKISGLIGGYHSAISMPIAALDAVFKYTHVAWGATSPRLSNKGEYPYFLRTIPPDSIIGGAMWRFISDFSIPSVAYLYADEAYGQGLFQAVVDRATTSKEAFRVTGVSVPYMPNDYDTEVARERIRLAKQQGQKVWLLGMTGDQGTPFFGVAHSEGVLTPESGYQMLGAGALQLSVAADVLPVGYMYFSPISKGALWSQFEEMWKLLNVEDVLGDSAQSAFKIDKWQAAPAQWKVNLSDATFATAATIPPEAPFLFDAAYAFVFAVNDLIKDGYTFAEAKDELMLEAMYNVTFEGVSGTVGYTSQGDRAASFELINAHPGAGGKEEQVPMLYSAITDALERSGAGAGPELYWMTGEPGWAIPEVYVSCDPGFWKDSATTNSTLLCVECEPGTISPGGIVTTCDACPAGKVANRPRGATMCVDCLPGTFGAESKSTQCADCGRGAFAADSGLTSCLLCPVGQYTNETGSTDCSDCAAGKRSPQLWDTLQAVEVKGLLEWVPFEGAQSREACGCSPGHYEQAGECHPCIEGMLCPGKEVFIEKYYYAPANDPGFVFQCFSGDPLRCPGGAPGSCADGRKNSSLGCATCEMDKITGPDGTCVECAGSDILPILATLLAGIAGLILVYRIVDSSSPVPKNRSVLLITVTGSQMVTVLQQLGVFGSIPLEWNQPFKGLLDIVSLLNFKLDLLPMDCVGRMEPLGKFAFRLFVVLIFLAFMFLLHAVVVVVWHGSNFRSRRPALIGAVGSVMSTFYISIVASMLSPFQCGDHPNGVRTVRDYPSVMCWNETSEAGSTYGAMVALGLVATLIPLTFLSGACWVVWKLPEKLANGDTEFLRSFRFLFFRFRANTHWYIIVFLGRNLAIALVPAIGDALVQIFVLQAILVTLLTITVYTKPWSVNTANFLDAANTIFMCVVLVVFALFAKDVDGGVLANLCVAIVVFAFIALLSGVGWALYRYFVSGKPYKFFICYHKEGAGNFARLLKMCLDSQKKPAFAEADELWDVGHLFSMVASDTANVVVVCSKEVLMRARCMGEVTVAHVNKISLQKILLPGFEFPDEHFVSRYEEHSPDASLLATQGLSLDLVKAALAWLRDCPSLEIATELGVDEVKTLVANVIKGKAFTLKSAPRTSGTGQPLPVRDSRKSWHVLSESRNFILADMTHLESASTALMIHRLLVPLLGDDPLAIPAPFTTDHAAIFPNTERILLVCDGALFSSGHVANMLMLAAEANIAVLPIVSDTAFRWPTSGALQEITKVGAALLKQAGSKYSGADYAFVVARIFKAEIAMEMHPQSPANVLELRARQLEDRLRAEPRRLNVEQSSLTGLPGNDEAINEAALADDDLAAALAAYPECLKGHETAQF